MIVVAIIQIIFSIYIIWKISTSFDLAANYLTRNMAQGIKGPTINAAASSLPELIISSMFLFYYGDIKGFSAGYATIIGSSAFNIACIPIISYLFLYYKNKKIELKIDRDVVVEDTFFLILSFVILFFGFYFGLNLFISFLLIILYIIYVIYIYNNRTSRMESQNIQASSSNSIHSEDNSSNLLYSILNLRLFTIIFNNRLSTFSSYFVILLSVILIGTSCHLLINAVDLISDLFNVNLFFSAFIIAAISSSIPDTILSVKDAKNGRIIDSFSNAYGSNIFDICIGLGLPLMVYNFMYKSISIDIPIDRIGFIGDYFLDGNLFLWSLIMLFFFTLIVSCIYFYRSLNLKTVMLVLSIYIIYILLLIIY